MNIFIISQLKFDDAVSELIVMNIEPTQLMWKMEKCEVYPYVP